MRVSEVPVELDMAERPATVGGDVGRLLGTLVRDDLIAAPAGRVSLP